VAKLSVTIYGITANVSPAGGYSLGSGESYQFTVNFTVPNTTTVGNFTGSFKAYVSSNASAYESKSFTFSVLPTEETKAAINLSYQNISSDLAALIAQLNAMKLDPRYNQSVISAIEELINSANSSLLQARSAIDSDDYISANSLISQVNTSINNAKAQMEGAQAGIASLVVQYGIWFWVAVGVIIIFVVGFFIYMFYPSKLSAGYQPSKGYTHPTGQEGVGEKIKKAFKRKKKEKTKPVVTAAVTTQQEPPKEEEGHYDTFHYSEGYKKEKSYSYQYPKGEGKGLFGRFKKEKEKSPQMHISQFAAQAAEEKKKDKQQEPN
jgi:hypothetical protein